MSQEILNHVASSSMKQSVPVLKPGMNVKVHQRITEGEKTRTQIFQGLVIKVSSGTGVNKTFTVRKIVDGIGVEKIFPFYAPSLEKIELMKRGKVRRAKLYYMRDRQGKATRLRDLPLGELEWVEGTPEEVEEEAPVADAPAPEETAAPAKEEAPAEEAKEEEKAE